MEMTHYMELLSTHQPWNLIVYMAIPVILAETLAISELYLLFTGKTAGKIKTISRISGILAGLYFTAIFLYLFKTAVIPLTADGGWRGAADIIAVGMYLLGVVPLAGIALLELQLIYKKASQHKKRMLHAGFIGAFLVVAHVAMIFGMLNPTKLGWTGSTAASSSTAADMSMSQMTDGLKGKTADDFDKRFLSEMIVHHQGAIDMAKLAEKQAKHQEVKDLAQDIVRTQEAEILQMQQWQALWEYNSSGSTEHGHSMPGM